VGRTVGEIAVFGRQAQEVKNEVLRWMEENDIKKIEERENLVKGRQGTPVGLGLTAPKYFEISLKPNQNGVVVHTEGWIGVYGVSEASFSSSALLGGIPRRKGWRLMEALWNRLKAMSK
jgi:hypothetical protein